MPPINPYNFVPVVGAPARSSYSGIDRFRNDNYSGVLECRLIASAPLVSADHRTTEQYALLDENRNPMLDKYGKPLKKIKVFRFLRDGLGVPIIQGASLKGMVRSVFEAARDTCMPLAAAEGVSVKSRDTNIPYEYEPLGAHARCKDLSQLCPGCRLFGMIEGETLHCSSRVRFTDARLPAEQLVQGRRFLRELSNPKPHHFATYGEGIKGGPIAGRKFYYHHGANPDFAVAERACNDRSSAIDEYAGVGAAFTFQVFVHDLSPDELGSLLLVLELDDGLGHKIGMGKAIGLGSCKITVDADPIKTRLHRSARYSAWNTTVVPEDVWRSCKRSTELPPALVEVLRTNKADDGIIGYPGRNYPTESIDARGVFGGGEELRRRPKQPIARAAEPLVKTPPEVSPGETAAWLKELWEDELVLVTAQGHEERRRLKQVQRLKKSTVLKGGEWFILFGEGEGLKLAP